MFSPEYATQVNWMYSGAQREIVDCEGKHKVRPDEFFDLRQPSGRGAVGRCRCTRSFRQHLEDEPFHRQTRETISVSKLAVQTMSEPVNRLSAATCRLVENN